MNLFSAQPEKINWAKAEFKPFGSGSLMRGIPGDYYSPSRFVRLAYLNTHYPTKSSEEENVARMFHTLAGVSMIDGAAAMVANGIVTGVSAGTATITAKTEDGNFEKTVYTGGYSAATKTYYYNTYEDYEIKKVCLSDYDVNSSELVQA